MKVGFFLVGRDPSSYAAIAKTADQIGYESIWIREHLVLPNEIPATYPYTDDGTSPLRPKSPLFDPFAILSYLAAVTQHIRLGTGVYILPLRHPFITARAVATVDLLSHGRVILGVGVGWLQEEFEAVGEDFTNRSQRTDEIIEIIKQLWTVDTIQFQGRHYSFGQIKFEPKPVQLPHPPIQFGGTSPAALRRAARLGDGWFGVYHSPEETAEIAKRLNCLRKDAGRGGDPFEVTVIANTAPTADVLKRYQEAGADRVLVTPWDSTEKRPSLQNMLDGLERFAQDVIAKLEE